MSPRPPAMRQGRCYPVEGKAKLSERVPSVKFKARGGYSPAVNVCATASRFRMSAIFPIPGANRLISTR